MVTPRTRSYALALTKPADDRCGCVTGHCNASGFVMVPPAIFACDGGVCLPDDWGLQLDAFEETVAPFVENGTIAGIFLGDEKICGGVPLSNYTAVLTHLRAAFGQYCSLPC